MHQKRATHLQTPNRRARIGDAVVATNCPDLRFAIRYSRFHSCVNILHASCWAVKWNSGDKTSFYRVEIEYSNPIADKGLHGYGDSRRVGCAHRSLVTGTPKDTPKPFDELDLC